MLKIHTFSSAEAAFFVNSFIVESEDALVLVDTQFLTSSARELCAAIRSHTKQLKAVVITHPHPDHFNGLAEVLRNWPDLPVYATQVTIDVIKATEAEKRAAWTPVYGDDYPQQTAFPNIAVKPDQTIEVGGIKLVVDDLGEGESADITVVYFPQSNDLIASDLLYNRVHPWLAEGRTKQWIKQIDSVIEKYRDALSVFAGHGQVTQIDGLLLQSEYLHYFRNLVREQVTNLGLITPDEKSAIGKQMRTRYKDYPLAMLIEMNIDGVAKELASERAK
jgi:glyoxylase-like metal-dependent hydrolase (beta-lactamase superfamily II)